MAEPEYPLQLLVDSWLGVVDECTDAKKPYTEVAELCYQFYSGLSGFMWDGKFKDKYFGKSDQKIATPPIAVTINKAFELVAIFGPYLYWKYPQRAACRYERPQLSADVLGDPSDPEVQQFWQYLTQQAAANERGSQMAASLMSTYLDYSQREQPGGGLAEHSTLAITEALLRGRGCLWVEPYQYPGSKQTLTRCVYDSVRDLLIDADCTDPTLETAQYVIRRHVNTTWDVEKLFGWPVGSLKGKGTHESAKTAGGRTDRGRQKSDRNSGRAFDLMTWYEIYSKCGVGTRLYMDSGKSLLDERFDEVVGDYARICVAKGVEWPLNCPPKKWKGATENQIRRMFDWPVPYWRDNRWPVAVLDFYTQPESVWPVPLLAPALGELICINVLASVITSQTYENSRQILGVLASAKQSVEQALRSSQSPVVVEINESVQKSINDCIQYLQRPEINMDVWKTIDWLGQVFDKRTGLSELMYAMNPGGAQSRSAEDARIKAENAQVRPDYMANRVAQWQQTAAELEKQCAYWHVKASDIRGLLGPIGALGWEKYIEQAEPEEIFRGMRCRVEANDLKKPNKAREAENLQNIGQFLLAELSKHADATGDTEPLNAFIRDYGASIDQDTSEWTMGERVPMPPPPEVAQFQQQQMQLEAAKLQADVQKSQMDAQSKAQEAADAERMLQVEMAGKQMELEFDAQRGEQELQLEREKAGLQLQVEAAKSEQQIALEREKTGQQMALERAKGQQQLTLNAQQAQQQQAQQAMQFTQGLQQSRMDHAQKMAQSREAAKTKAAAAKKKPQGSRK